MSSISVFKAILEFRISSANLKLYLLYLKDSPKGILSVSDDINFALSLPLLEICGEQTRFDRGEKNFYRGL